MLLETLMMYIMLDFNLITKKLRIFLIFFFFIHSAIAETPKMYIYFILYTVTLYITSINTECVHVLIYIILYIYISKATARLAELKERKKEKRSRKK